jgi:hypothetical protein
MTGMKAYYLTRAIIAVTIGGLLIVGGSPRWVGIGVGGLTMLWFFVAPRVGRYAVHPEQGATALRRDERGEAIHNAAARNAFAVCMLAIAGVLLHAWATGLDGVGIAVLEGILVLGILVYFASDYWLGRVQP